MRYDHMPFFDNHSHPLDPNRLVMTPDEFAREWLHGFRDLPNGQVSDELCYHVHHLGCVQTMVHLLSQHFGCEETIEAVTEARNQRVAKLGVKGWAAELGKDAGIFCTLIDSDLPWQDPTLDLFYGSVLRHIQMDGIFFELLEAKSSFAEVRQAFIDKITEMARTGYVSIKSHLGELFGMEIRYVSPDEAEAAFADAKAGHQDARRTLYYAIFHQAMLTAHELSIPIHVHTGITGGYWDGHMDDADPYKMAPFLRNVPHMQETVLVLLHSNYPYMGGAAMMAHTFPNVYVDLAWVLPWTALDFERALLDLIANAPTTKILLGSGQHNIPEIAWTASLVARRALSHCLGRMVREDLISEKQADELAKNILYRNACRLYNVPKPAKG